MNKRLLSFIGWIIITVFAVLMLPNLDDLVREKGSAELPATMQSIVAKDLLKEMDQGEGEQYDLIAVFHQSDNKELQSEQKEAIEEVIQSLMADEDKLGITSMLRPFENEEVDQQLVAEDGSTVLLQFSIDANKGTISEIRKQVEPYFEVENIDTYLTGVDLVLEDFMQSTQEGVKKTEIIAVIFIIVILIAVFRSPIVPFISLLTVGVSYIVSLSILTNLVDQFDFPFSNFTQVFLVVILFGVGTDYNILLYTRFKEELSTGIDTLSAIKATYVSAGKTVVYSGIAVLIGFMALYLAEFRLYQASSGVAIGIGVLLLVLMTLNPFFMGVLGKKMFWPSKAVEGHGDSKIWSFLAETSFKRPLIGLMIVALTVSPFIYLYSNKMNFNDLVEINDKYESKQGITMIEEHFPPGISSPTTLVLQHDEGVVNQQALSEIDALTDSILQVDGVSEVYSVTRPYGEKIEEFYLNEQADTLGSGIGEANSGVTQIYDGLAEATEQMQEAELTNGVSSVQQLIDGTSQLQQGANELQTALQSVQRGFQNGAGGATQLTEGLSEAEVNVAKLATGAKELQASYQQLASGFGQFTTIFEVVAEAIDGAQNGYAQIEHTMSMLVQESPELAQNAKVQTVIGIAQQAQQQLADVKIKLETATTQYKSVLNSMTLANKSFTTLTNAVTQLQGVIAQLQEGSSTLQQGLSKGATDSKTLVAESAKLPEGLLAVQDGQKQMQQGLQDLTTQLTTLVDGLSASTEGLADVREGLNSAQDYLGGLSESKSTEKFYIPQEVLEGEEFKEALAQYTSKDGHYTSMMIVLDVNPYTEEAMDIVQKVDEQVKASQNGIFLAEAKMALAGKSIENVDLQEMASSDFSRTIVIMLVGIGLVLIFLTRSIWQSLIIIASLLLSYFAALGLSEYLTKHVLHVDLMSWNAPFFGFIMIVALGVDYSIFLMMRYREYEEKDEAVIVQAAKHIGGVVLPAAIILGGTFAALVPSGILTLIEVALIVIVGLLFLSFITMPIFIPSMMSITAKLRGFLNKYRKWF